MIASFLTAAVAWSAASVSAAPVLAELFTSQSCSSCPPAQEVFGRLADDPDIVTLEWHVDYWDDLNYGRYGRWKDPYSDPAFTARQRAYNRQLRGTGSVYTPQAIIGGRAELNGAAERSVRAQIDQQARRLKRSPLTLTKQGDVIAIETRADQPTTLFVAYFETQSITDVRRGENHDTQFSGRHTVTHMEILAESAAGRIIASAPTPEPGRGCAIILQAQGHGPVIGASYCP